MKYTITLKPTEHMVKVSRELQFLREIPLYFQMNQIQREVA